jgi:hypothetical protein
MRPDGVRELLAFDDWQGTGRAIPVMPRTPPPLRASLVHPRDNDGVYIVQDVCSFAVPARTPIYFQVLDAKGYTIQTMRSWSTLQNGEHFSCTGCHENKLEAGPREPFTQNTTVALSKPVQKLRPFAGTEHPLIRRLASQSWLDSMENDLGVNAPRTLDPNAPVVSVSLGDRGGPGRRVFYRVVAQALSYQTATSRCVACRSRMTG